MAPINEDTSKEWKNSIQNYVYRNCYIQAPWQKKTHFLMADFLLEQGMAFMEGGRLTLQCLVNVTNHTCENISH